VSAVLALAAAVLVAVLLIALAVALALAVLLSPLADDDAVVCGVAVGLPDPVGCFLRFGLVVPQPVAVLELGGELAEADAEALAELDAPPELVSPLALAVGDGEAVLPVWPGVLVVAGLVGGGLTGAVVGADVGRQLGLGAAAGLAAAET
jgi:hypothetical protein